MRINKPGTTGSGPEFRPADTLILKKPKEFGTWVSMYNFRASYFWEKWGGNWIIFDWIHDSRGRGDCADD